MWVTQEVAVMERRWWLVPVKKDWSVMFTILSLQTGNYILLRKPGQDLINQRLSVPFCLLQPEFTAGHIHLMCNKSAPWPTGRNEKSCLLYWDSYCDGEYRSVKISVKSIKLIIFLPLFHPYNCKHLTCFCVMDFISGL